MNTSNFFLARSNWFYFRVISLIFIAGLIAGTASPQINIDISIKEQPAPDWIVAFCTIGLFIIAFKARNQWLHQKDLENHAEFSKSFYQYFLLKVNALNPTKIELKILAELEKIKFFMRELNAEGLNRIQLTLDAKQDELAKHKKNYEAFYLELDTAKEKMLVCASVIRVNRSKVKDFSLMLATYQMEDINKDFKKFRREINEVYLDIQRMHFSEDELIHLP